MEGRKRESAEALQPPYFFMWAITAVRKCEHMMFFRSSRAQKITHIDVLGIFVHRFPNKTVSYEDFFPRNFGVGGVKKIPWKISSGAQSEDLGPSRAVLMGTKSCIKILNFSTRFSCRRRFRNAPYGEKILLMGKSYVWA